MPERTRLMLVDDHALFREALARLLATQPDFEVAAEAATVDEAVEAISQASIDVVLLDINLGTHQGGAFVSLARAAGFKGKILVVTAGISQIEAMRLLDRGCEGIVLKQERPTLLIERIRAIIEGEGARRSPLDASAQEMLRKLQQETQPVFTQRERQVLRLVCRGQTNKEIASALGISEPLVKSFVQQLFNKSGVRNRAQLVRVAVERYWEAVEDGAQDSRLS